MTVVTTFAKPPCPGDGARGWHQYERRPGQDTKTVQGVGMSAVPTLDHQEPKDRTHVRERSKP